MINDLKSLIPGFELDVVSARPRKMLVDFSNQCSGEWLTYSLLEHYLRMATNASQEDQVQDEKEESKAPEQHGNVHVIFVGSLQMLPHY